MTWLKTLLPLKILPSTSVTSVIQSKMWYKNNCNQSKGNLLTVTR